MKALYIKILITLTVFQSTLMAQQNVIVNGQSFKSNLEIVQAQMSRERIAIVLDEIDKSDPKYQTDNCTNCRDGKSLILDVSFKRAFKFPIEEIDSIYLRVSNLQESLAEYNFNSRELDQYESSRNKNEEAQLKNNAEVIKEKGTLIAKQLQEGKITPQEAEKQLMALMEPQFKALEHSTAMKNIDNIDEYEERTVYSINFYNDEALTETNAFSGYLYIKRFNEKEFVAEFRGETIEECVEKRSASSKEEKDKCKSKTSNFLPDAKVLKEGPGRIDINISIKEFIYNR